MTRATGPPTVTSVACHPGYADTGLQRRGPEQSGSRLRLNRMETANRLFAQSAARGALPMPYAPPPTGRRVASLQFEATVSV